MKNEYGLDISYFRKWVERLHLGLDRYTPDELARELSRMAFTADGDETKKEVERLSK